MPVPTQEEPLQSASIKSQSVAILDCGAQYTKVIDRRVRELSVCSEILPLSTPAGDLKDFGAVILSGGPHSVFADDAPVFDPAILTLGIPVLGICYGMQLMAHHLGGTVEPGLVKEFGETDITVSAANLLFGGTPPTQTVLMSHGDHVSHVPSGFEKLAVSGNILAAMGHADKKLYGVQFHPEVELSVYGTEILNHFLYDISGFTGTYSLENRLDGMLEEIRSTVGNGNVFVLVSGGVDSAVTAALLLKALKPEQVYALHVDTGFMRHEESDRVCDALKNSGLQHLQHIKAQDTFLNAFSDIDGKTVGPLKDITDPEDKRRIIGDVFFKLTQDAILGLDLNLDQTYIAQGTLRPDLIESGNIGVSKIAHKIKTHHNVVPVIQAQREKGLIIEPNRDWHKDEVRRIGRMLGLPEDIVERQPFPGPGLAIRILCTDTPYVTDEFETLNGDVNQLAQTIGLQGNILPVKSVGVQGDYRTYSYLSVLSGNYSTDWETIRSVAQQIPNQHHTVNRVALILNQTVQLPPVIRHITPTTLTPDTCTLLRQIDFDVTEAFRKAGLSKGISQLLAVLVPVGLTPGRYSVAIRAVVTGDYMTARPARLGEEIPWEFITSLAQQLVSAYPIDWVMYDVTSKPPATVEWE